MRFLLPLILLLLAAAPLRAESVDLALVLAVDVSDSIDDEERKLQRKGYVHAFVRPDVLNAIKSGAHGRIAVTYFEWADASYQSLLVDWTVIDSAESARSFSEKLDAAPVRKGHFTSISAAISFSLSLLRRIPHQPERKIIDISGDGRNNDGPPVSEARAAALSWDVTINGLPIENERSLYASNLVPGQLAQYFTNEVIGGPDAFVMTAKSFGDIEDAIRKKLLREIAGNGEQRTVRRAAAQ